MSAAIKRSRPAATALTVTLLSLVAGVGPAVGAVARPDGAGAGGAPGANIAAQDTVTLRLDEAVERALANYPTVAASRAASEAARASHGRAKAEWWPELRLSGSLTRYEEPMIVSPIHAFDPGATPAFDRTLLQGGGHLSWTVFDGGGREATIRRARWEASAAEAELEGTVQALVAAVSDAYLDARSRAEVLGAHERRIAALESELDRVRQLREVGRAAEVEVLRVEAALASADAERLSVASDLDVASRELARLMGAPLDEPASRGLARPRIAARGLPPREELVSRAAASSPAVARAGRLRTAAEASLAVARSGRWPDLEAFGSWIDYAGVDSEHQLEWAAGVRLAVPVFTGGRIGQGIARARAELEGADERLRLALTETERAVDRAVSRVEETEARERSLETAVARSTEVVRIERLRVETGTGTQTDYLDAEADLLAVEAALAETRHASIRARVELARVLGELGPAWLDENLEMDR